LETGDDIELMVPGQALTDVSRCWPTGLLLLLLWLQDNVPDPSVGWSPPRCAKLGAAMLDALNKVMPHLRTPDPPAKL
jgi:hypothetical protein